jgi:Rrf2 family transcriptional regulator, repressor of oqxAB
MTGRDWTTLGWFRVAVQILVMLAAKDEACSSALLAEGLDAHAVFLRRVLAQLARANLVAAREGRDGGYRLARPADEITLADVFCAIHHLTAAENNAAAERLALAEAAPALDAAEVFDATGLAPVLDAVGQEVERQALGVFQRYTIAALAAQTAQTAPAN